MQKEQLAFHKRSLQNGQGGIAVPYVQREYYKRGTLWANIEINEHTRSRLQSLARPRFATFRQKFTQNTNVGRYKSITGYTVSTRTLNVW